MHRCELQWVHTLKEYPLYRNDFITACLSQPSHTIVLTSSNVIYSLCGTVNIVI